MEKPPSIEHHRYVGDKRTQVVYDTELLGTDDDTTAAISDIVATAQFAMFGPDTLAEAANRGYRPHRSIRRAVAAESA
jgi:hypothetical protein